jgi:EAL domain-containing protein (putative c-di-GMP-specific phosphodiesterase class I)
VAGHRGTAVAEREFHQILQGRRLETVFQPIVHLDSGVTVGYEALVRGPAGSAFASAQSLVEEAYRAGRVVEFDWAARASACRAALRAGLPTDCLLFLNIEPLAMNSECPPDLWPDIEHGFQAFKVVLEVTERSLDRDPSSLLEGIDRQRPRVAGLALDDVGSRLRSLSMLPVLAADVLKLDLTVTHGGPTPAAMKILDIAYEESERTGATILAEGVATAGHADVARSLGATLGQGRFLGPPAPLPHRVKRVARTLRFGSASLPEPRTPFDALAGRTIGRASAGLLMPLSRQVAYRSADLTAPALVIVLVPERGLFSPADSHRLARLAGRGVATGALGPGLGAEPARGVHGAQVHDPTLDGEWAVLALSPGSAGAMLARAVPGTRSEFEFGVTHDRMRVISAARCLLRRLGTPPSAMADLLD